MGNASIKRFEWFKAVLQVEGLSPAAKNVAGALAIQFANDETGQLNPSQKTLADYLKVHKDTVKRALRELRSAGWLTSFGDGGRGKAPMLRLLSPSKIVPFRYSKVGQRKQDVASERGEELPPQPKKRGDDLRQKGGGYVPPQYKDKQSKEQKARAREAFANHRFTGNVTDGPIVLIQKSHFQLLNEWADWLKERNLPRLCDLPISQSGENGNLVFFLPFRKPPTDGTRTEEAEMFFEQLLQTAGENHAA